LKLADFRGGVGVGEVLDGEPAAEGSPGGAVPARDVVCGGAADACELSCDDELAVVLGRREDVADAAGVARRDVLRVGEDIGARDLLPGVAVPLGDGVEGVATGSPSRGGDVEAGGGPVVDREDVAGGGEAVVGAEGVPRAGEGLADDASAVLCADPEGGPGAVVEDGDVAYGVAPGLDEDGVAGGLDGPPGGAVPSGEVDGDGAAGVGEASTGVERGALGVGDDGERLDAGGVGG
jgi:hypothetical protein